MTTHRTMLSLAFAFALALTVQAQPAPLQGSPLARALSECRSQTDPAPRLACYDAAAARLEAAERVGDVVVVDREQARAARRQAFGFQLPSLDIFDRAVPEKIDRVVLTIAGASQDGDGRWVLRTTEGQVWRQIDTRNLPKPSPGSAAEIRTAALGSFFIKIDGRAMRARREQ